MISQSMAEEKVEQSYSTTQGVSLMEAFWVWLRVAIYSFGGPAGQIAVMHEIVVEEKRWISESRFLHALNYCMLLPGPEAQQLATYIGWLMHKTKGGLLAGALFILPGFLSIMLLSILYAGYQEVPMIQGIFFGLKPAVMAVVVYAVFRIGRRVLKNDVMVGLAALSFIAIFFFNIPFPLIVISAGIIGTLGRHYAIEKFDVIQGYQIENQSVSQRENHLSTSPSPPSLLKSFQVLSIGLMLWFAPLAALMLTPGGNQVFIEINTFFSKTATVTFGGAYAVLAYLAQQAVDVYGWLEPGEMLNGLGMAETTPGPLIQVVQYVGFMGAYRNAGSLDPMTAGILGAILTTWVTFVPCFIWIFLGAPYIEHLRGNKSLTSALSAITAAIVGVVLNLAVWFSLHAIFGKVVEVYEGPLRLLIPQWNTLSWPSLFIVIGAFVALFRYKQSMLMTIAGSALVGTFYYLTFGA